MTGIGIGLLGCGTVGRGVVDLIDREHDRIHRRFGIDLEIRRILIRDAEKDRAPVDPSLFTTSAVEVIDRDVDIVVELVGGVDCAAAYVRRAITRGRDVVTANKALLAMHGPELLRDARRRGVDVGFEASVCAGVPVIRALRNGFAADSIERISGIVNGTCNYILSRMERDGIEFKEALKDAQEAGFAEADPSLDIDGEDSAQKMSILAGLVFDDAPRKTSVRGIREITADDVQRAARRKSVIRLIAEARLATGGVEVTVGPRELPRSHPLACVHEENNAVIVSGRAVGEVMFTGRGAGSMPTAAAVLSDVIEIAKSRERFGMVRRT